VAGQRGSRQGLAITLGFIVSLLLLTTATHSVSAQSKTKAKPAAKKNWMVIKGIGALKMHQTLRVEDDGKVFYGRPLAQDSGKLALLRWDGRISVVPREKKYELFSNGFAPYTSEELEKRLAKEYGARYVVKSSKHFVIVQPRTNGTDWAKRYETVFSQYRRWFERRGVTIGKPQFPMIVVVLGSRNEFNRALEGQV